MMFYNEKVSPSIVSPSKTTNTSVVYVTPENQLIWLQYIHASFNVGALSNSCYGHIKIVDSIGLVLFEETSTSFLSPGSITFLNVVPGASSHLSSTKVMSVGIASDFPMEQYTITIDMPGSIAGDTLSDVVFAGLLSTK